MIKMIFQILTKYRIHSYVLLFIISLISNCRLNADETGEISVPIIVSSNNPIYLQALAGFQYSFRHKSSIYYMNSAREEYPDIKDFYSQISSQEPPLIVTIGNDAGRTAREYIKDKPTLFLMIDAPKLMKPEQGKFCGYEKDVSFSEYFSTLRELNSSARRVLTVYSTEEGEILTGAGEYEDIWKGVLFKRLKAGSKDELKRILNDNLGKFDAFYMSSDRIYDQEIFEYVSDFCRKNKIILMTLYPALVELGATFALVPDFSSQGVSAGQMANQITEGKAECEMGPVLQPEQPLLYLNETYSLESGITIPESLKIKLKTDRMLSFGIELYYKKMYKSAKNIFQSILNRDQKNKTARYYLSETVNVSAKAEIDINWKKAEKQLKAKNYRDARNYYKKILELNPEYLPARDGVENSLKNESDGIRQDAKNKDSAGFQFQAMRRYKEALTILPSNKEAQNELSSIRQRELRKLDEYFKAGLTFYNKRDYSRSLDIFSDLLLLVPDDKKVQEYQRLSQIKKNAMYRLSNCQNGTDEKCSLLKRK